MYRHTPAPAPGCTCGGRVVLPNKLLPVLYRHTLAPGCTWGGGGVLPNQLLPVSQLEPDPWLNLRPRIAFRSLLPKICGMGNWGRDTRRDD